MKRELFRFLKEYTTDVLSINKLIVSSFLLSNKYDVIENEHIRSLIIDQSDSGFNELNLFNSKFRIDSLEKVIEAFEYVISPEDKIVSGAVYTPSNIRQFIVGNIFSKHENIADKTICDPACGCSGFLYTAIQQMKVQTDKTYIEIIEENIYGLDVKDYAVERSKILLTLLALENGEDHKVIQFNLFVGNALLSDWGRENINFEGFDIVIGNPPYVCSRNIDKESKALLSQWKVSSSGHPDLYIPFFELGMALLKTDGHLGFITMNSFFKSLNGRALRRYFKEESYRFSIIDFGGEQIFSSNSTYTCICLLEKSKANGIKFSSSKQNELNNLSFINISYDLLDSQNGWNLRLPELIKKIESVGKPFSSLFKTSSGIATLKNDVYIFDAIREDSDFYYINEKTPIEKKSCREVVNTNKLTKMTNINSLKKKIIFPYYYKDDTAIVIPEKEFKDKYPETYSYLLSKKEILSARDKGKGNYTEWYSYGRKQALELYKYKLLFPHIAPKTPNFIISSDRDLFFHNGLSLLSNDLKNLKVAQKIMQSRLFWFYIKNTSKPYGANYMSLSKNYIKSFGVYNFTEKEKKWLRAEKNQVIIDEFLERKYDIQLGSYL
ncbi:MAG: N-6 DNA methylase [Blastopirellula sp.]|nr:MAG: N-6 DNA methylase [Blastopirellula sp.]